MTDTTKVKCPYCGSNNVEYNGDYSTTTSICDQWECLKCGKDFEGDCSEPIEWTEEDFDQPIW